MPQIVSSDGARLHYLESGDPDGRPVLLVAGFKAPATSWKPQLGALEAAGHRVIALDRRGHGASEVGPDGAHTMDRHGADIGDAIAALGLGSATVVGQSMGANDAELELLNDHAKRDWRPAIAATTVPVLFVAGRESEFWPSEHAAAAASLAALGQSAVIDKAGHATNIEQPKAFNGGLLNWLAR